MKIALHPGYIRSKNDQEMHYISCGQLIQLYRLNPRDCKFWDDSNPDLFRGEDGLNYVHLYPRNAGDYDEIASQLREALE